MATEETVAIFMTSVFLSSLQSEELFLSETGGMNIEKWFAAPNLWDWNVIGGQIMMNQEAMHKACQNGANVFRVSPGIRTNN